MTDTINNQTTAQTNKLAPAPQPMPEQKTSAPAAAPPPKTAPAPPVPPDQPITKPLAETKIKTTEPSSVAPDEPKEKTKESQAPATEQTIGQTEEIQEKNKTEQKISENNIQETGKELPHSENDLTPFEIIEHEQEPPEKLWLKDAISTLPENEKLETDINKMPATITTMPKSTPAQPANKPAKTDFAVQFRNKLKQLLGIANQKRQAKAQANLDKIMEYAIEKQKVTNDDVERLTGVKHIQAARYLKKLKKQGKLVRFGKTINIFYKPVKE